MKTYIRLLTLGILFIALILRPGAARADDLDMFNTVMPPNILWLLDTSASMYGMPCSPAGDVYTTTPARCDYDFFNGLGYVSTTTYPYFDPDFASGNEKTLFQSNSYYVYGYHNSNQVTYWDEDSAVRYAYTDTAICGGATCGSQSACQTQVQNKGFYHWPGGVANCPARRIVFKGNFLNFYPPKFMIARKVLKNLVGIEERVRMGIMTFDSSNGGAVHPMPPGGEPLSPSCAQQGCIRCLDATTSNWVNARASLLNEIDGLSFMNNTPLAESLFNAGQVFSMSYTTKTGCTQGYYCTAGWSAYTKALGTGVNEIGLASATNFSDSVPYRCSYNAVVIITDGQPSADQNVPCEIQNFDDDCNDGLNNHPLCTVNASCTARIIPSAGNNYSTDYVDDVAKFLLDTDLIPSTMMDLTGRIFDGIQNVHTYAVGFGMGGGDPLLQDVATNGDGLYLTAESYDELVQALRDVLFDIIRRARTFSAPLIPATQGSSGSASLSYIYFASFVPNEPAWMGRLSAFQLLEEGKDYNNDGTADDLNGDGLVTQGAKFIVDRNRAMVTQDSFGNLVGAPFWEAGAKLNTKTASDRLIYTAQAGSRVEFNTTNITPAELGLVSTDTAGRDKLVNWVRGIDTYDDDGDGDTTEERDWKLGDIFHSRTVVVSAPDKDSYVDPFGSGGDLGYSKDDSAGKQFATIYAQRKKVAFVGANDGMIHAFDSGDFIAGDDSSTPWINESKTLSGGYWGSGTGEELFAFIPPNLLPYLKTLRSSHHYMVDGACRAAEIWADANADGVHTASEWKTLLICAEREGGAAYIALDVTNPARLGTADYPKFAWQFTDTKLSYTWGDPVFSKIKVKAGTAVKERWISVIGGGYAATGDPQNTAYSAATLGKAVFFVDMTDGSKLWEFSSSPPSGSGTTVADFLYAFPSNVAVVDRDFNFWDDSFYIGDLGGQMWRLDVRNPDTAFWAARKLFDARDTTTPIYRPIYFPAAVAYDDRQYLWVYFGTGDRNYPNRCNTAEKYYAVQDTYNRTTGLYATFTESDLVNASTLSALGAGELPLADYTKYGWYLPLATNEKNFGASEVFGFATFMTTFLPNSCATSGGGGAAKCTDNDPCGGMNGNSFLYMVDYITGRGLSIAAEGDSGAYRTSTGAATYSSGGSAGRLLVGGAPTLGDGKQSIGSEISTGVQIFTTEDPFTATIIAGTSSSILPNLIQFKPGVLGISTDYWWERWQGELCY